MIRYFFGWYDGNIWGNLIASFLWAVPAYLYGRYHMKNLNRRLDKQDAKSSLMHKHIKEIKEAQDD